MTQANCTACILATIRALTNFATTNTSSADWGILSDGKSEKGIYVIVVPGESEQEWIAPTTYLTHRTFRLEAWQRYKERDSTVAASLAARQDELAAGIMAAPKLGDVAATIVDSTVETGEEPEEMWGPASGRRNAKQVRKWLRGNQFVKVTEETRT